MDSGYRRHGAYDSRLDVIMTTKQKQERIRQRLAALGYHVRSINGFAMSIVRTQNQIQAA